MGELDRSPFVLYLALKSGAPANARALVFFRVRVPGRIRRFAQSAYVYETLDLVGWIAQSVEQRTENPCVGGSIPSPATTSNTIITGEQMVDLIAVLLLPPWQHA